LDEIETAKLSHAEKGLPKELYCFIQYYSGKREFVYEELKEKLGENFILDSRYKEAEASFVEALEIRQKLAEENPSVYSASVANSLNNLEGLRNKMREM